MKSFLNFLLFALLFTYPSCKDDEPVNKDPEVKASFTLPTQNLFVGCPIKLTNSSTGATAYAWDFGDGKMSTEQNPEHIYTTVGTYNIKLKASNTTKSNDVTQSIKIEPAPPISASFTIPAGTVFTDRPILFTNTSIGATQSEWNFGDGKTSTETSPTHTFTTAGTFDVVLKTSGSKGKAETKQTITVQVGLTNLDFTVPAGPNYNGCEVMFENKVLGALNIEWSFGDGGTSTIYSPSYSYNEPGTYTVKMKASNGFDSKEVSKTVSIVSPNKFNSQYSSFGFDVFSYGVFQTTSGIAVPTVELNGLNTAHTSFKLVLDIVDNNGNKTRNEITSMNKIFVNAAAVKGADNNIFIGVTYYENIGSNWYTELFKISETGNKLWQVNLFNFSTRKVTGLFPEKNGGCFLLNVNIGGITYLDKINNLGQMIGAKRIQNQTLASSFEELFSGIELENGDILLVGKTKRISTNLFEAWVIKVNNNLDPIFGVSKQVGSSGDCVFKEIIPSHKPGFYVIAGQITGAKKEDAILWQIDENGNGDILNIFQSDEPDWFESVIKTQDGYIAVGGSWSGGGYAKGLVIRFDGFGTSSPVPYLYSKSFNTFLDNVGAGPDCSLYFNGITDRAHDSDPDLYIVKTDYRGKGN